MEWDQKDRTLWSYPDIAARMLQYVEASHIKELYRRMIFNMFVRNIDDHPRNHSFLNPQADLQLSPVYDLVPALTRKGVGSNFSLAMSIGELGRAATLANALSRAAQFGLSERDAQEMVDDLLTSLSNWDEVYHQAGLSESDVETIAPSIWR